MYMLFRDLFTYFQLLKGMYVITCKRRSIYVYCEIRRTCELTGLRSPESLSNLLMRPLPRPARFHSRSILGLKIFVCMSVTA